jgi:hypothetical protein
LHLDGAVFCYYVQKGKNRKILLENFIVWPRDKWHKSLTDEMILDAAERQMTTLDSPGFCLSCGLEQEGHEPDARRHECESCGAHNVYGAEELVLALAW